jgi:phosphoheptose isomerase
VAERVHFEGPRGREALKWYYGAADVFVTTPWYEPFGITPVEAMACGTPVLGSDVGGIRFTVRDGETGYLVPARDSDAVGDRLADMYENPALMATLGQQAVQRANDLFTWKKVASALADVYDDLMLRRQPRPRQTAEQLGVVDRAFEDALSTLETSRRRIATAVIDLADIIATSFLNGGKLLICGNGGSAAEAQHLAAEFVGRFLSDRAALPAIALTTDSSVLTAWSNDYGFDDVFARQVAALGRRGDVLLCISTSGRSPNLTRAFEVARGLGMDTIAMLGAGGGDARWLADRSLMVPSNDTRRVQEVHLLAIHLLCELVEARLQVPVRAELEAVDEEPQALAAGEAA